MSWIIIGAIIIIAAIAITALTRNKASLDNNFPYQKKERLFTSAERSFLGVLNQAIGEKAQIFGKVRVADVVSPKKGMSSSDWQTAFNKISGKHFDFLLCDKANLSVICAVELNDKSHSSASRQKRDAFLESMCNAAGLPLIQVAAKATYTLSEITRLLSPHLSLEVPSEQPLNHAAVEEILLQKVCPRCSSLMVKRIAKQGSNVGKEFWACIAFPKCRYTAAIWSLRARPPLI